QGRHAVQSKCLDFITYQGGLTWPPPGGSSDHRHISRGDALRVPGGWAKEVPTMPASKEFAILIEDRPGTLGKICRSLADGTATILAFQSVPLAGKRLVRLCVHNPSTATDVLTAERVMYSEEEIAHVKAANKAGELARLAARLGDANININYAYSGLESGTNAPIVVFGVSDATKAASILDQAAAAAGRESLSISQGHKGAAAAAPFLLLFLVLLLHGLFRCLFAGVAGYSK